MQARQAGTTGGVLGRNVGQKQRAERTSWHGRQGWKAVGHGGQARWAGTVSGQGRWAGTMGKFGGQSYQVGMMGKNVVHPCRENTYSCFLARRESLGQGMAGGA